MKFMTSVVVYPGKTGQYIFFMGNSPGTGLFGELCLPGLPQQQFFFNLIKCLHLDDFIFTYIFTQ